MVNGFVRIRPCFFFVIFYIPVGNMPSESVPDAAPEAGRRREPRGLHPPDGEQTDEAKFRGTPAARWSWQTQNLKISSSSPRGATSPPSSTTLSLSASSSRGSLSKTSGAGGAPPSASLGALILRRGFFAL